MVTEIKHTGTPRHSGRYPWGSGDDPYQRANEDFLGAIKELRRRGVSDVDIAKGLGLENTSNLRAKISIEGNKRDAARAAMAYRLKEKGYSNIAIAKRMQISDHTVADLLNPSIERKRQITEQIANALKSEVSKDRYIDVGSGVEVDLGVSGTRKNIAIAMLKEQGYQVFVIPQEQQGTGKYTWMKVLAPPGVTKQEVSRNREKIKTIGLHSEDGGETIEPEPPPLYLDKKRVFVRYGDDPISGKDKDGVIELRRNVEDLSLKLFSLTFT